MFCIKKQRRLALWLFFLIIVLAKYIPPKSSMDFFLAGLLISLLIVALWTAIFHQEKMLMWKEGENIHVAGRFYITRIPIHQIKALRIFYKGIYPYRIAIEMDGKEILSDHMSVASTEADYGDFIQQVRVFCSEYNLPLKE